MRSQRIAGLRRKAGFTIVELAAVIFIITVLVSLLCAALNRTKSRTLRLACLDNMRQLQLAWAMYIDENDDRLPLNQSNPLIPVSNSTNSWVAGNPTIDTSTANIRRGTLFQYMRAVNSYRCPLDSSTVFGHPDILRTRSYSMNRFLAGDPAPNLKPEPRRAYNDIVNPRPENTFVFIEEHELSVWGSSFFVSPRSRLAAASLAWFSTPSDRHDQGCNITFADGHIEYWKWYSPKAGAESTTTDGRQLRDIRRLQAAVPPQYD